MFAVNDVTMVEKLYFSRHVLSWCGVNFRCEVPSLDVHQGAFQGIGKLDC